MEQIQLVIVHHGGNNSGIWIHPKLGVHFAYWLSPKFAVWVGDQIQQIIKQQQQTPEQQRIDEIIKLLYGLIDFSMGMGYTGYSMSVETLEAASFSM